MKSAWKKLFLPVILSLVGASLVIKLGFPQLLSVYIRTGIGDCIKIPVLCMAPQKEAPSLTIDRDYIQGLVPLKFSDPYTEISAPKGFKVVQELIAKPFYKKNRGRTHDAVIYLIHQPPGYFIRLFPHVKKLGITNNYEFFRRLIYTRESEIKGVNDAFFIILKSIFIPDLGDQRQVKMIRFSSEGRRYFINYNLTVTGNFFDCTIITNEDEFFKVYAKDMNSVLDLTKVFSIISTIYGETK